MVQQSLSTTGEGSGAESFGFVRQRIGEVSLEKMKELLFAHICDFVEMDPAQSVRLCEQWFEGDYSKVAKALKD